jgi:hypothetical protein
MERDAKIIYAFIALMFFMFLAAGVSLVTLLEECGGPFRCFGKASAQIEKEYNEGRKQ